MSRTTDNTIRYLIASDRGYWAGDGWTYSRFDVCFYESRKAAESDAATIDRETEISKVDLRVLYE